MGDTADERGPAELHERVARLELELTAQSHAIEAQSHAIEAQSQAIAALRDELGRLQTAGDSVLRPRKPAMTPAPTMAPPTLAADPYHWPEPSASAARPATPVTSVATGAFGLPPAPAASAALPSAPPAPAPPQRSLENRIGSQLFNRLGIVALLIGVAYFLKLAIDNHWIHTTPLGRILTGLLVGAGVVLWSERFRRKGYGPFAYSLKAVGSGTLYLTLWASFHIYHLLPSWAALLLMVGVTAWNALMAVTQDAELLAVYALVGGFATPALLGSAGNHEVFLFTYLLAMDIAVLLLLVRKPWPRLLLGSFPATVAYFIGWYVAQFKPDEASITALFVVLLSAPFVAVALAGKQREGVGEGLLTPVGAAAFLSLAMYSVLQDSGRHSWLPWMAVALGALYVLLMRFRRNGVAEAVHLALAVTFLTVAIPLKAEGRWITIGWLAEGSALIAVAARMLGPGVQLRVRSVMRWMACAALLLGVGESLVLWASETAPRAFANARFATELTAAAALALTAWLARAAAAAPDDTRNGTPPWAPLALVATLGTHILAVLAVTREIIAFWSTGPAETAAYRDQLSALGTAAFVAAYGAVLLAWVFARVTAPGARQTMLRSLAVAALTVGSAITLLDPVISSGTPAQVIFNCRVLFEAVVLGSLAFTAFRAWRTHAEHTGERHWLLLAGASFVAFHLLAIIAGVREIVSFFALRSGSDSSLAESFTISAWLMLYAAGLLAAGFWRRMAFIRWQGLGLVVFTIGKVFLYDVRNVSPGYRVLSIVALGVLLMAVSFAYQKDWLGLRDDLPAADPAPAPPSEVQP